MLFVVSEGVEVLRAEQKIHYNTVYDVLVDLFLDGST